MKRVVKAWLPEACRSWWSRRFGWRWFRGDYRTWAEAQRASSGYDQAAILERVVHATREVEAGRALWERDGELFHAPEVNRPLLDALQASRPPGERLEVVDFGGALGSIWRQHRRELGDVRWRVVEQSHYVAAGREFASDTLSFHESMADALAQGPAHVLLFSSVLQYLPEPRRVLAEAAAAGAGSLIVDRTGCIAAPESRLVVQWTPPALGGGSYPCWLFSRTELLAPLASAYALHAEWPALDKLAHDVRHVGFHFFLRK
jgi:putative methyltransferase (TIGR04325 family)